MVHWFDLKLVFPKGPDGESSARRRLELSAKDKITADIRARGYTPQIESFQLIWSTPYEGKASMLGIR